MIEALLQLGEYEKDQGRSPEAKKLYCEAFAIAQRFNRLHLMEAAKKKLLELVAR